MDENAKIVKIKSPESSDSAEEVVVSPRYTLEPTASLPHLPDDCLLGIMKFLGPIELESLSQISERLQALVSDKNLWTSIDFRPHKLTIQELGNYFKYLYDTTKFVALRGFVTESSGKDWRQEILMPNLIQEICKRCPELETLILDEHFAIFQELNLECFPRTLRHLSMKGCVMTGLDPQHSYFQRMHVLLPFMKVLVLSNCAWVSPYDFMAISKCYHLEELRMDGCPQLGECVAYTSLAARFGFHSLKILDLRNTRMGDSDVGCFNRSRNLTHLYLQCPESDTEDSDGMCGDPICKEVPFRNDFMDSTQDEVGVQLANAINSDEQECVATPKCTLNSLNHINKLLNNCQSDNKPDASPALEKSNEREENGDPDLPQASTSHGKLHIMDPAGPSGRRVGMSRKRQSSDSSSDENSSVPQCSSTNASDLDPPESNWSIEKHSLLKKKRLLSSKSKSSKSKDDDCGSRKAKRKCTEADSPLKNYKSVSMSVPADSFNVAEPGSSTNEQQDRNLLLQMPNPFIPISDQPVANENKTESSQPSEAMIESTSKQTWAFQTDENGTTYRFLRNWRRNCGVNGPRLFRFPHHEPSSDSTISDMCIISFASNDSEIDGVGYVRIISPQLLSARPKLHTLVLKNYKMITDATLQYLLKLTSLRHLDVSGTSVTEGGILQFKLKRPEVDVICDFKNLPV